MILHTEILGNGDPIVFLHTGLQTGMTDFEHQREHFKKNYKVILPDLRGHGKSISNNFSDFFNDSANDLLETFNSLEIKSAYIVGCSLGALVGLIFAKKFPDRVKSLTLSGVIPEKPANWLEMHKQDVERQTKLLENEELVSYFDNLHSSDWKQFIYMSRDKNWYPFDKTGDLSDLEMPTLFMVGEGNAHERIGAQVYPQMNPNVHTAVIPYASHLVHTEQPDMYTLALAKFFNK
ncbi:alpha/beta fold hydrolase [Virgibacillus doumboii]|uniref:alpha/beta fold hydrolase n=1 Tax=Virgibacillus doumboii TaxID=2697503 RepID=UPI0013E03141|nr:alpha/beta hydrolase [Virgibacillus doumboii]